MDNNFWNTLEEDFYERLEKAEADIANDELYFYALEQGISMKEAEMEILATEESELNDIFENEENN